MSSTTMPTMHFGPEWMRTRYHSAARSQPPLSPPPCGPTGVSTYSALVSPTPPSQNVQGDETYPFRYSKEELLRIYNESGVKSGLGLEVERWEGVVRDVGSQPVAFREMNHIEKKLFQAPLNSDLRRRQSIDFLSTKSPGTDRQRLSLNIPPTTNGGPPSRFPLIRQVDGTEQSTPTITRKQTSPAQQHFQPSPCDANFPSSHRTLGYAPNFDGTLNGGGSRMARHRACEKPARADLSLSRDPDLLSKSKGIGIPEERKLDTNHLEIATDPFGCPAPSDTQKLRITTQDLIVDLPAIAPSNASGSPLLSTAATDYAMVEWSYKDHYGQIQGPFHGDLMQKWCDDGYFTGDLPIKRTHLDMQWITVDQLIKEHGRSKIFLTPPASYPPPGLSTYRKNSVHQGNFSQEHHIFNSSLHPATLLNLHNHRLESISNNSDSPSSFSGKFSNGSPDLNSIGGRGNYFGDQLGHAQGFSVIPEQSPAINKRSTYNEHHIDSSLSTAFSGISSRGHSINGFGYNQTLTSGNNGWNVPLVNVGLTSNLDSPVHQGPLDRSTFSSVRNGSMNHFGTEVSSQETTPEEISSFRPSGFSECSNGASVPHINTTESPHSESPQFSSTSADKSFEQHASGPLLNSPFMDDLDPNCIVPPFSPRTEMSMSRHVDIFDHSKTTSENIAMVQVSARDSPVEHLQAQQLEDSWLPVSAADKSSNDEFTDPEGSTFCAPFHQNEEDRLSDAAKSITTNVEEVDDAHFTSVSEHSAASVQKPRASSGKSRVTTSRHSPVSNPKDSHSTIAEPLVASLKAAWAKDVDNTLKSPGSLVSLREIQEAEARKVEARKAADLKRERSTRVATQAADSVPFVATWGLPTSQTGPISRTIDATKESITLTLASPAPVWMNAVKSSTSKKSMKEIQEEERRKKTASKETVAEAAKRANAETVQKVIVPSIQSGGAWTTVGPSGKAVANPTRANEVKATANPNATSWANGSTATGPVSGTRTHAVTTKAEEPAFPSRDFLRWLSHSLKGLNSSVNVEEIVSMLLSFPLDPDPSTIELISELIYANSTTLDGRRFATDFISKRKSDSTPRPKYSGANNKAPSNVVSIADVVKAVPKRTQAEYGFKVVSKKKKGTRS